MSWLQIAGLVVLGIVAFLAWGFFRITRRAKDAARAVFTVEETDIPALVAECIRVGREKLGVTLDLKSIDASAESLDYLLEPKSRMRMKTAFEVPGHSGRFVLPLGAFLGELVRTHVAGSRWIPREGGGLAMEVPQAESTLTMHPFDKVLKHAATGSEGDILAYIHVALGKRVMNE